MTSSKSKQFLSYFWVNTSNTIQHIAPFIGICNLWKYILWYIFMLIFISMYIITFITFITKFHWSVKIFTDVNTLNINCNSLRNIPIWSILCIVKLIRTCRIGLILLNLLLFLHIIFMIILLILCILHRDLLLLIHIIRGWPPLNYLRRLLLILWIHLLLFL